MLRLIQAPVGAAFEAIAPESIDCAVFSPPYRALDGYSDLLMFEVGTLLERVLRPGARAFMVFGQTIEGPVRPFEAAQEVARAGKHLSHGQTIVWAKSIAIKGVTHGQFNPQPSKVWLNNTHEYIFQFVKDGDYRPIDRLAVGVPFTEKCLSVYTPVLIRIDGSLRMTILSEAREVFLSGRKIEIPVWDFEKQVATWAPVTMFSEPRRQPVSAMTLKDGSVVLASDNHQFPLRKKNGRAGCYVLSLATLEEIKTRQSRWTSRELALFVAPSLAPLIQESRGSLFTEETGYIVGLFLAEGWLPKNSTAISWAGHAKETNDPKFGGLLDAYFQKTFGVCVKRYTGSTENGIRFHVNSPVFRAILEELIQGSGALGKRLRWSRCLRHGKGFLKGIVDGYLKGDGYECGDGRFIVGMGKNRPLLEDMRRLCLLVGYEFRQNADSISRTFGGEFVRLNYWIRKTSGGPRRMATVGGLLTESLKGIQPAGEVLTMDVQVDHPSAMFFLANGMLVHNSNLSRENRGKNGDNRCAGDTIHIPYPTTGKNKKKFHKHEFPLDVATYCLKLSGIGNQTARPIVLDCFMGGGTTAEAANRLNFDSVGVEISDKSVETTKNRISPLTQVEVIRV